MNEGKIIIPATDKAGNVAPARAALRATCINMAEGFGGYTVTDGQGGWIDNQGHLVEEDVKIVTVAYDDYSDPNADMFLLNSARQVAADLDQDCVYVKFADGIVELVEPWKYDNMAGCDAPQDQGEAFEYVNDQRA